MTGWMWAVPAIVGVTLGAVIGAYLRGERRRQLATSGGIAIMWSAASVAIFGPVADSLGPTVGLAVRAAMAIATFGFFGWLLWRAATQ